MTGTEESGSGRRRDEAVITGCFLAGTVAALALSATWWGGGSTQLQGLFLGLTFAALAAGLILWSHRLLPQGPVEQARHQLDSPPEVDQAVAADLERGGITRRSAMSRGLAVCGAALVAALAYPIRSLGPSPGRALLETPWKGGRRAVTEDGRLVRAQDVPEDGLVTVFPEGHEGSSDGQAVLVRVDPGALALPASRRGWTPLGLVAYSKLCTHAGCPVGLYLPEERELLCPCHQSRFDVLTGAKPLSGPAAVPLPQLPLVIGDDGIIASTGDFSAPVIPTFWHRG